MKVTLAHLALFAGLHLTQSADEAGDSQNAANLPLSFGTRFAVLNLDMTNGIVMGIKDTPAGQQWVKNCGNWIDTVHNQRPPPLSIFTRIFFLNERRPEISPDIPFGKVVGLLNATEASPQGQLFPAFKPLDNFDVVMTKTRYYAGAGNALEEVLTSQKIDTVVMSGIRTSGVIMATTSRLFDLNYRVIVISNNTIETGTDNGISKALLEEVFPKMPVEVVTIEQALNALRTSKADPLF